MFKNYTHKTFGQEYVFKKSGQNVDLKSAKTLKQLAVTKIRIFWVQVHLSPLKLTFFLKILSGCTEYIAKSMLKKWGRYVDLNI